ncbi:ArsR/SmtB family transcription factor [Haloferacaceae archaeon DSL9]
MSDSLNSSKAAADAVGRLHDDPDDRIDALRARAASPDVVEAKLRVFKALANEDRLRVLTALRNGECCGCELQAALDLPQSTVATHLRTLKDAGLLRSRRKGKWTYYRVADAAVFDVLALAAEIRAGAE